MKNLEVAKSFVQGKTASTANVMSSGTRYYSYSTVLGQRLNSKTFIVNMTRYSTTSAKHLSDLRWALQASGKKYKIIYVYKVHRGAQDLTRYLPR